MRRVLVLMTVLALIAVVLPLSLGGASAQSGPRTPPSAANLDNPCTDGSALIQYGNTFTGDIDSEVPYLSGCFQGQQGDTVIIDLAATRGDFDPYLWLYDGTMSRVLAENDDIARGNLASQITVALPSAGNYAVFGSHAFNSRFSGGYRFTLTKQGGGNGGLQGPGLGAKTTPTVTPGADEVQLTIRCDTGEVIQGGVQFGFINIVAGFTYTVTVFGLDDFDPVVAVETAPGIGQCNDDTPAAAGSEIAVPGTGRLVANGLSAQVRFSMQRVGNPVITVGAINGQAGQFVMVIEGLAISPSDELDGFVIRVASRVAEEPIYVYMVSRYTDLDPFLQLYAGEGLDNAYGEDGSLQADLIDTNNVSLIFECDDAGGTGCEDTPAFPGGGVAIANGSSYVAGQYDSGLGVIPGTSDAMLFAFGSYSGRTAGQYAIMIIGSVPGAR